MDGFLCHTQELFAPGETLQFLLLLPAAAKDSDVKITCLQGTAEVVRVRASAPERDYTIGCRLSGYRVITKFDPASEEMSAMLSEPGRFATWLAGA